MRTRVRARATAVVAVALAVACGPADEPAAGGAAPTAVLEVDLAIGELDGPAEYVFGRIGGVALDAGDRIFAADHQASEVRVFDRDGSFLFSFGRSGAGPGEFVGPCCLAFAPDGLLWLRDTGNSRYNGYRIGESGAEHVATRRMAHGSPGLHATLTFDAHGRLIDVGARAGEDGVIRTARFFLDEEGRAMREQTIEPPPADRIGMYTVDRMVGENRGRFFFYQPFGPRHLVAHGPGGDYAEAIGSEYAIRWLDPEGALLHEIRYDDVGPALTATERDTARASLERTADWAGVRVGQLPFGVPERKPVLTGLQFDRDGRLWAFRSPTEGDPYLVDVFDRAGALVRRVEWPRDVGHQIAFIAGDRGVAVSSDVLGVQRVVRFRVTEAAGSTG